MDGRVPSPKEYMTQLSVARVTLFSATTLCCMSLVTGCGMSGATVTPAIVAPSTSSITGNWEGPLVPAANSAPLSLLYGAISQTTGVTAQGAFTTSVLHIQGQCFNGVPTIPAQGFLQNTALTLNSFEVSQQYLLLNATVTNSGSTLNGTYKVNGGCAQGASGTFNAVRYAPLTGTYNGSATAPGSTTRSLELVLTQSPDDSGDGSFELTGTAALSGFPCFTQGTSASNGRVSGSSFSILYTTNETTPSTVKLVGSFDPAARNITTMTYTVNGGSCTGFTGTGSMKSAK